MKLLVTGIEPPDKINSWSGTPYHMTRALSAEFELCFVGGLRGNEFLYHRIVSKLYSVLGLGSYRLRSEPSVLKAFSKRLTATIKREAPDAILSMGCEPLAYLEPGIPAYLVHDSTFRQLCKLYPHFQQLSDRSRRTGEVAQMKGFERATAAIAASEWARRSACADYGLASAKTAVIPMGANLTDAPNIREVTESIERRLLSKSIDFLFIGVEWLRKGGDTAASIVETLTKLGLDAKLHIVGCTPPKSISDKAFVVSHGFLSKKEPDEAAALRDLFTRAMFFIVPSTAECYGCVFCEASSFGVPSISRAVGGIPEIISDGETGLLLSDKMHQKRLIEVIVNLITDPAKYREMAIRARRDYEDRLNWNVYSVALRKLIAV